LTCTVVPDWLMIETWIGRWLLSMQQISDDVADGRARVAAAVLRRGETGSERRRRLLRILRSGGAAKLLL
jgi:hypothetical protein